MANQIIILSMVKGDLLLTEGNYSAPHDLFENNANPGDVITWLSGEGIISFESVNTLDPGLFVNPPSPIVKGNVTVGWMATIGNPQTDPGPYTLTANGIVWDPKIRVLSNDPETNTRETTALALANA